MRWFDWNAVRRKDGTNLPHLVQDDVIYYVTFRLWDSLPADVYAELVARRDAWMEAHPKPHSEADEEELRQVYSMPMERYLDEGHGSCVMRQPEVRKDLLKIMLHFDGQRYEVGDYVVMPNHMHLLMRTLNGFDFEDICYRWKNISATAINRIVSRTGRLWQSEGFDHIVRSARKLQEHREYIRDNAKGLREVEFSLGEGCLFRE